MDRRQLRLALALIVTPWPKLGLLTKVGESKSLVLLESKLFELFLAPTAADTTAWGEQKCVLVAEAVTW